MGVAEEFPAEGRRGAAPGWWAQRPGRLPRADAKQRDTRFDDGPRARLIGKGRQQEARLSYGGHILTENRNGLIVDAVLTQATGYAEREAALQLVDRQRLRPGATLGADKAYDTQAFGAGLEANHIVPHIARNTNRRRSAVHEDIATTLGYAVSQRRRKLVEEPFGWLKTVAQSRKLR